MNIELTDLEVGYLTQLLDATARRAIYDGKQMVEKGVQFSDLPADSPLVAYGRLGMENLRSVLVKLTVGGGGE